MDDFETFKASREKMDPSTRKMSDHQWQQAYAAYRSSRERVSGGGSSASGESSGRRRRRSSSSADSHTPSTQSPAAQIRNEVRASSAYSDLRVIVDVLAWVAVGVVILAAAVKLLYFTNISVALVALLEAVVSVIAVIGLRLLVHVIIDIPDVALHDRLAREAIEARKKVAEE